jgi:hypothetical protein
VIRECRTCGLIERTWDDVFAGPRPSCFEMDKSYMRFRATVNGEERMLFSLNHPDLYLEFARRVNG